MKLIKWGKKNKYVDFTGMEAILEQTIQPVEPRQEFIRKLRYQIIDQYEPIQEEVKEHKQRTTLLVGASLVGGLLTLVMGIRIVMTLIASISLLLHWKKQIQPEQLMAPRRIN